MDRLLHAAIRILPQTVAALTQPTGAAPSVHRGGLARSARKESAAAADRVHTHKAAFEAEKDHRRGAADKPPFDRSARYQRCGTSQLLPVAAVAGEVRDLASSDGSRFAEAHLCHHRSKPARIRPPAAERPRCALDLIVTGRGRLRPCAIHLVVNRRRWFYRADRRAAFRRWHPWLLFHVLRGRGPLGGPLEEVHSVHRRGNEIALSDVAPEC